MSIFYITISIMIALLSFFVTLVNDRTVSTGKAIAIALVVLFLWPFIVAAVTGYLAVGYFKVHREEVAEAEEADEQFETTEESDANWDSIEENEDE